MSQSRSDASFFSKVGLSVGFAIGALALSAFASSTWTAPSTTPPGGNVDIPLNVGTSNQTKTGGSIQINGGFGIAGGPFIYIPSGVTPAAGQVLTADATTPGKVVWATLPATQSYTDCLGEGIVHVIGNPSMNDGGGSAGNDSLEVYCHAGLARYCLSYESNCPWRGVSNLATVDTAHTCSMHGLNSASYAPGHPTWIYVANAWGDMWNGQSNYYCEADTSTGSSYATQLGFKHTYYLTPVSVTCTTASATLQNLAGNSVAWSATPSGGDGTTYSYVWTTTNFTATSSSGSTFTVTYPSKGTKSTTVAVSSGGQTRTVTCTPTVTIQ